MDICVSMDIYISILLLYGYLLHYDPPRPLPVYMRNKLVNITVIWIYMLVCIYISVCYYNMEMCQSMYYNIGVY